MAYQRAAGKSRHRPRKRFGQHFLADEHIADRIVEAAGLTADDTVLEIGPGKGVLTGRLLEKARLVYAVEIDRDLARSLRERFAENAGFRLVEADILRLDLSELFGDDTGPVRVVSNIPYNISKPIIELLVRSRDIVTDAVLMVQLEVAKRLLAKPGSKDYGLSTLNLALFAEGEKLMNVRPGSFRPPPAVMSGVISLSFSKTCRYSLADVGVFYRLTGAAFRQRRKMVRNTLIPYIMSLGIDRGDADDLITSARIDPRSRPEDIDIYGFVRLSNSLVKVRPGIASSEGNP